MAYVSMTPSEYDEVDFDKVSEIAEDFRERVEKTPQFIDVIEFLEEIDEPIHEADEEVVDGRNFQEFSVFDSTVSGHVSGHVFAQTENSLQGLSVELDVEDKSLEEVEGLVRGVVRFVSDNGGSNPEVSYLKNRGEVDIRFYMGSV